MTVSDPTALDLFAAVRRAPDDDTLRLVLADRLDELDAPTVECPKCEGKRWADAPDPVTGRTTGEWQTSCNHCKYTGVVLDTTCHDRAALIRAQVELAKYPPTSENIVNDAGLCLGASVRVVLPDEKELAARAEALIAANDRRWRQGAKCERCRQRSSTSKPIPGCPVCRGTGDIGGLTRRAGVPGVACSVNGWNHHITYHGGTARVRVADLAECVGRATCRKCGGSGGLTRFHGPGSTNSYRCDCAKCDGSGNVTVPSDWLLTVVRAHADVLEVWCQTPAPILVGEYTYSHSQLPDALFDLIDGHDGSTEDAARTALARALVTWAHDHAKENRT